MRKDKRPRIPMLERDQVSPEVGALYDALIEQRGVVPNMFKTIAHTPALALGFAAFLKPLMGDGALPGYYKEIDSYASCPATGLRLLNHRTLCFGETEGRQRGADRGCQRKLRKRPIQRGGKNRSPMCRQASPVTARDRR